MEGGDMDSLFEGMVLFNPTQMDADHSQATPSSTSQQPLDEDIFSDLTLVVDLPDTDLQSQSQSSSSSRRRKRSGLRIGYGRDTIDVDVDVDPSPPPASPLDSMFVADVSASESITSDAAAAVSISVNTQPSTATDADGVSVSANTQPSTDADAVSVSANTQPSTTTDVISQPSSATESERRLSPQVETFSEEGFSQIKDTIHDKLNHARQLVTSASSARKDAIRSRRKALENANLASDKYMQLENQLEQACEAEDFETAEKVSEYLSAADKEKQIFATSLKQADAFLGALDLKLQHALESHIAAEEECAILLHHYATVSE